MKQVKEVLVSSGKYNMACIVRHGYSLLSSILLKDVLWPSEHRLFNGIKCDENSSLPIRVLHLISLW
ncbi:hypothetical protein Pfo_021789 [Paulownia fortunei]|nr:hypothetical protein Pfo_021789 [Paulownia fortunei]